MAGHTFHQDLILSVVSSGVGPLVTVLVGTLAVGTAVNRVSRNYAQRRADLEVGVALISDLSRIANTLYMQIRIHEDRRGRAETSDSALKQSAADLDLAYRETSVEREVLEGKLRVYLEAATAADSFHAAMDCLTVLYFGIVDAPESKVEQIVADNADARPEGLRHSGLTSSQLRTRSDVYEQYRTELKAAAKSVQVLSRSM